MGVLFVNSTLLLFITPPEQQKVVEHRVISNAYIFLLSICLSASEELAYLDWQKFEIWEQLVVKEWIMMGEANT